MARLMTRRITYAGIDMTTLLPESHSRNTDRSTR
jgi:hypothetical protein